MDLNPRSYPIGCFTVNFLETSAVLLSPYAAISVTKLLLCEATEISPGACYGINFPN